MASRHSVGIGSLLRIGATPSGTMNEGYRMGSITSRQIAVFIGGLLLVGDGRVLPVAASFLIYWQPHD